jgi:hypothetical protein
MSKSNRRREQAPKPRNLDYAKAMQELRQGSRTTAIPSGKQYKREKAGARGRDW